MKAKVHYLTDPRHLLPAGYDRQAFVRYLRASSLTACGLDRIKRSLVWSAGRRLVTCRRCRRSRAWRGMAVGG